MSKTQKSNPAAVALGRLGGKQKSEKQTEARRLTVVKAREGLKKKRQSAKLYPSVYHHHIGFEYYQLNKDGTHEEIEISLPRRRNPIEVRVGQGVAKAKKGVAE